MLVNLNEVLKIAEKNQNAIGSFNTPNLASIRAIIRAAEAEDQPVVLTHAQIHEEKGLCILEEIAPAMLWHAARAKVPVCVHLDHGTDMDYVRRSLDAGFTSIMYDGSELPLEENIALTKQAVDMAHAVGASVEAELGSMGKRQGGFGGATSAAATDNRVSIHTDPATAEEFVAATGVDALACAFGTVHGFYNAEPKLDFDRVAEIRSRIPAAIVMHGGSGVSEEDYRKVIAAGVRKVNYYTYMAKAGAEAVSNKTYTQFHDVLMDAEEAMYENVRDAIRVFAQK